jgi:uncharacterized membrane-anchored protein
LGNPIPPRQLGSDFGAHPAQAQPLERVRNAALKVPEITVYFWIIKLLSTAMGEATSDFLVYGINRYLAVILGSIGFAIAMALQLSIRRYIPWVYWLAVVMVAVFGTMAADVLHIVFNVPYQMTSLLFASALVVIFIAWYATERTLSIHTIYTFRRELFYWATVCATFALGTALGDLTAYVVGLGFFVSGILYTVLFLLPGLGFWLFRLNAIFAFWFAYVMTRPLGASFADWIGKEKDLRGLGFGTGPLSIILGALIAGFVVYVTISRVDMKGRE